MYRPFFRLLFLFTIFNTHHLVQSLEAPARIVLDEAINFTKQLSELHNDYRKQLDELCAGDESCFLKPLPSWNSTSDFESYLRRMFKIIREYAPEHADQQKEFFTEGVIKFDLWDKETGKGQQAMSSAHSPLLDAIKDGLKLFSRLKSMWIKIKDLEKLKNYFVNEISQKEDKDRLEFVHNIMEKFYKLARKAELYEIIKFEIPDWYKTIGKELMHRETEIHKNICEMAKTAASINKKENLDNINAAYTGEQNVSIALKYKEIILWQWLISGWIEIWTRIIKLQNIMNKTDLNGRMLTYDTVAGKIVVELMHFKRKVVNFVVDKSTTMSSWEKRVNTAADIKYWENVGKAEIQKLNGQRFTLETAENILFIPMAKLRFMYDHVYDTIDCGNIYADYEDNLQDGSSKLTKPNIPETTKDILKELLKFSNFNCVASLQRHHSNMENTIKVETEKNENEKNLIRSKSDSLKESLRNSGRKISFDIPKKEEKTKGIIRSNSTGTNLLTGTADTISFLNQQMGNKTNDMSKFISSETKIEGQNDLKLPNSSHALSIKPISSNTASYPIAASQRWKSLKPVFLLGSRSRSRGRSKSRERRSKSRGRVSSHSRFSKKEEEESQSVLRNWNDNPTWRESDEPKNYTEQKSKTSMSSSSQGDKYSRENKRSRSRERKSTSPKHSQQRSKSRERNEERQNPRRSRSRDTHIRQSRSRDREDDHNGGRSRSRGRQGRHQSRSRGRKEENIPARSNSLNREQHASRGRDKGNHRERSRENGKRESRKNGYDERRHDRNRSKSRRR